MELTEFIGGMIFLGGFYDEKILDVFVENRHVFVFPVPILTQTVFFFER